MAPALGSRGLEPLPHVTRYGVISDAAFRCKVKGKAQVDSKADVCRAREQRDLFTPLNSFGL